MTEPNDDELADNDELIESLLDEALAPYQGQMEPKLLQALREELGDQLAAMPSGRRLLRQMKPDRVVSRSGDVLAPGAEEADEGGKQGAG